MKICLGLITGLQLTSGRVTRQARRIHVTHAARAKTIRAMRMMRSMGGKPVD